MPLDTTTVEEFEDHIRSLIYTKGLEQVLRTVERSYRYWSYRFSSVCHLQKVDPFLEDILRNKLIAQKQFLRRHGTPNV